MLLFFVFDLFNQWSGLN